jgi:DNA-binding response OmpR family regulator
VAYKILIVDDDREIVEFIQRGLLRAGYEVANAFDGAEALLKVKETKPDVMLLDLMMPKLNGFEVLKEIREKYKEKWIPIIIVSAKQDLESVKASYGLEADHYLTKPCSMDNILRGIKIMISLIPLRKKNNEGEE